LKIEHLVLNIAHLKILNLIQNYQALKGRNILALGTTPETRYPPIPSPERAAYNK
jgi:hypothetical protein